MKRLPHATPSPLLTLPARCRRRGVLLLVVLCLLTLFAMIGVTFVLVASQSRRAIRAETRAEQYGDDYKKQCDEVFAQLVRDVTVPPSSTATPNNPRSVLMWHSLLNDMYGTDGVTGTVSSWANADVGGQLLDITISAAAVTNLQQPGVQSPAPYNYPSVQQLQTSGYFNGCVLTMTDGPAKDISTRIVGWGYNSAGSTYTARVVAFPGFTLSSPTQLNNYPFLINGRPFNGTGFGLNPLSTGTPTYLNAQDANGNYYALLPNAKFFTNNAAYPAFGGFGGADEDYDIWDPQNMALARVPLAATNVVPSIIVPSFHRPDLVAWWKNQPNWAGNPTLARQVLMRPLGPFNVAGVASGITPDHPNFTGSNPSSIFDAVNGPWDVDNDGDGIPDSVWVDVGFPVQTAPDGRRFKPLAAILCLDMDGRLNVNAHGNVVQADTYYPSYQAITSGGAGNPTLADYVFSITPPANINSVPRGAGYGPAEIYLGAAFNPSAIQTDYQNFYSGVQIGSMTYEGRYGGYGLTPPLPGNNSGAGNNPDDILALIKRFDLPTNYNYYTGQLTSYSSPLDLWGRAAVAIDYTGQPVYSYLNTPTWNAATPNYGLSMNLALTHGETPNDPYTLNLSRSRVRSTTATPTVNDNAFSAAELERMLRRYDIDATGLPDRLRYLLDPSGANPNDYPRMVTTDSYDLPTPAVLPTKDLGALLSVQNGGSLPAGLSIVDLYKAKMIQGLGFTPPLTLVQQQQINNEIAFKRVLPPEVVAGLRFDLNRPFGNGYDDDGINGVDEPSFSEFTAANEVSANWTAAFGAGVKFDLDNDGFVTLPTNDPSTTPLNSDIYARQQYAKQLYVMMMVLTDQWDTQAAPNTYAWSAEPGLSQQQQQELTARAIAQWAINVVDFRDADSAMTPFEYDVNPFNGWDVDGVLGSTDDNTVADRRLVWGCEYPELLLTETLAFHDRRVRDMTNFGQLNDMANPDPDMDQVRVPQGSLFFELYNTRGRNGASLPPITSTMRLPGDLYTSGANQQLDLGKMAPPGPSTPAYPVWRIAISASTLPGAGNTTNDVNSRSLGRTDRTNFDPFLANGSGTTDPHWSVFDPANAPGAVKIERVVWFTNTDPNANPDATLNGYFIFHNKANTSTLLNPGQYAVIGSRPTTYLGRMAASPTITAPQKIDLDTAGGQVTYTPSNGTAPNNAVTTFPALPIICSVATSQLPAGWPNDIGMSISEPLVTASYYTSLNLTGATTDPVGHNPPGILDTYSSPLDHPLDSQTANPNSPLAKDMILATGTKFNYKTAFLQRLANPSAPFDKVYNPYLTVDWQPIDLTVFNGEARQPSPKGDPDDMNYLTVPGTMLVGGRERGNPATGIPASTRPDLWRLQPQSPTSTTFQASSGGSAVFDYNLNQSLGYLNKTYGTPWTSAGGAQVGYKGAPNPVNNVTFPWLPWNNRPYASNMELLQVPPMSAEQLLRKFIATAIPVSPYDPVNGKPQGYEVPYRHLFNFFLGADGSAGNAPYYYRLLEYVQAPSQFVGTDTYLKPINFVNPLPSAATEQNLLSFLHPPFNKVSNYRDPGRINVNTIPTDAAGNSAVWGGVLYGWTGAPLPATILQSIQGTATLGTSPTLVPYPFRTAAGAAFTLPGVPAPTSEANLTLLRQNPGFPNNPLFTGLSATSYRDTDRNPYFRYEMLNRIGSSTTTRSNVYAVWVTVGYFEVTPNTVGGGGVDTAHPDGYQLGQELGIDTGDVKRHRAFYIYDRSIPVGFEPGKDHNYDKGILLKRFIE